MKKILKTEERNEKTRHIDKMSSSEMVRVIQDENLNAVRAIESELDAIAMAIDAISDRMAKGGRLFYIGCGTSGRLGVLDASECPPTYGVPHDRVIGIIAGGDGALRRAVEGAEDSREAGYADIIKSKTGLVIDPYFSATKIKWILDNVEGAREKANRGELCFGTVDSWLIWKLTGGAEHKTDYSNASRTMLYNINTLEWDEELLSLFDSPRSILPEVMPSASVFGYTDSSLFGEKILIGGVCGDQQAALFGQCAFSVGDLKNTYGTGAFLLMNTGATPYISDKGLLTTIAWGIGDKVTYAVEGSVFTCGAAIQWLRDGMKLIESAQDSEYYAKKVKDSGGVMVVPAFTGLGAPWWDPYARGMIIGITRATNKYHIIRATLESLAYQTTDVVELMESTTNIKVTSLNVDGGASANSLLMQFQSDILGIPTVRPACIETTALGAAYLCGLTVGVYESLDEIKANKKTEAIFSPTADCEWRAYNLSRWRKAVKRSFEWEC